VYKPPAKQMVISYPYKETGLDLIGLGLNLATGKLHV
jgi:hypothetical protein